MVSSKMNMERLVFKYFNAANCNLNFIFYDNFYENFEKIYSILYTKFFVSKSFETKKSVYLNGNAMLLVRLTKFGVFGMFSFYQPLTQIDS